MRVCLITSRIPPAHCGVGDYTAQLTEALVREGVEVFIITGRDQARDANALTPRIRNVLSGWGWHLSDELAKEMHELRPDLIIFQWVPFLYHKRGINPWIPLAAHRLHALGYQIQTMVHEPWVPFTRPSYLVTGPIQRVLLGLMVTASHRTTVTCRHWTELLQSRFPWRRDAISWAPVGSNIPIVQSDREARLRLRSRAGIAADCLVIGFFSPFGSGKCYKLMESAWQEIGRKHPSVRLVVLGARLDELKKAFPKLVGDSRVVGTGYLPKEEISLWLQTIDVLWGPYVDGISARRSAAIAGMAHGLPIVTTRGVATDPGLFDDSALAITDFDDSAFTRATLRLLENAEYRKQLSSAVRRLYERSFSWPAIIRRLLPAQSNRDSLAKPA